MRKNIVFYLAAFALLVFIYSFFSRAYLELVRHSELTDRKHILYTGFQNLSTKIKNAAVLNPTLNQAVGASKARNLFFSDSLGIIQELAILKTTVTDSINRRIVTELEAKIRPELSWIINSNVPDSIIYHRSPEHIASLVSIDSLITEGLQRTSFLLEYRKKELHTATRHLRNWMTLFIGVSVFLLIYTTTIFLKQRSKTKIKEKELEIILNRISDGVVSVDNDWRYTFLNNAAMATHPLGKKETLGKVIWDVHPGMKGTIFWDKYHEAMQHKKVVEIEDHYPPMDIWFSVKVYPSTDGLTIFYKDVTESKKAELQLSQTLKELKAYKFAIDESSIVAITDQKGVIKHANQNFCNISKYSLEELIGQDHRIINSGHHSKEFIRNLWATIASGKIWKGELKNKAKDGAIYWVDTTIVPFLDNKGKPYQYVAIRSDITERKKTETELAASEKQFRHTLDNMLEGAQIIGFDWRYRYVNDALAKHAKYSKEELIGYTVMEKFPGIEKAGIFKVYERCFYEREAIHLENEFTFPDNSIGWFELSFLPIPEGIFILSVDITDRKRAEEKLTKSEKIYKTIASNIPGSVIILLDTDYRYLLIEGDMLEKLGYSKEKLLGNKAQDVLPANIFEDAQKVLEKVLAGETVIRETNRGQVDLISRYVPLKDEHNEVYAILVAAIDVTPLKDAQRAVTELNRSLEERITHRTIELKRTNEELEAFSYSVSHDLRAPLRAIIGYAAILEEDYGEKLAIEAKEVIDVIKGSGEKMGRLIDDLLDFSRMGKKEIFKTNIDTAFIINEIIIEICLQHKPNSPICWDIKPLPEMNADISTIRQVWVNLISNAIKYSGNNTKPNIEIGSSRENNQTVYYIKDNGAGFDEKYKDKLFKVFQRLHDADEFEGTGVGLALVERIILKHGGKVWAEGKENEGACFYFSLPDEN